MRTIIVSFDTSPSGANEPYGPVMPKPGPPLPSALADTASGYGCIANLPEGAVGFTTIELKCNHIGTAREGLIDCVATDHAPHTEVDKAVEFGLAANGISGIETALGVLLAAVDAGRLPLARAIAALTVGPAAVLGSRSRRGRPGLNEGSPADLVVFDRADSWTVGASELRSRGRNSPLLGRTLPGRVLLTIADGRIAHEAPSD